MKPERERFKPVGIVVGILALVFGVLVIVWLFKTLN
jgi:hypothetical protein